MPVNAVLLACVLIIQGVFGSGWYSMGSLMSVSFAVQNAFSHSSDHLNFTFFFRSFCIGCIKSVKGAMNLQ